MALIINSYLIHYLLLIYDYIEDTRYRRNRKKKNNNISTYMMQYFFEKQFYKKCRHVPLSIDSKIMKNDILKTNLLF